ncbi:MAG: hypothetical protein ACFCUJ_10180 [Thiotrichales bacterium]
MAPEHNPATWAKPTISAIRHQRPKLTLLWRLLVAGLALLLLNHALVFRNVWPTPWIAPGTAFTVELGIALLVATWLTRRQRRLSGPALRGFALVYTALIVGRYAMVTAPALYGRPIDLYWDTRHLPNVLAMLATAAPPWLTLIAVAIPVAVLTLVYLATQLAWRHLGATLAEPSTRPAIAMCGLLLVGWFGAGQFHPALATERWFADRIGPLYARQVSLLAGTWSGLAAARGLPEAPRLTSNLARLEGADVVLMFLESYGATAYENPHHAEALSDARATLKAAIDGTGHTVVSARIRSTTFGGGSWLAHASWLGATPITSAETHAILLKTQRPSWPRLFAARGYATFGLMPGTRGPWPEGRFYGFDQIHDAQRLDYQGPEFGWWRIPDQYSWVRFATEVLHVDRSQPALVFFPTITSHMPFKPTPPLQPDWQRLLGPEPFDPNSVTAALAEPADWRDLGPAYTDSIAYSMRVLTDELERPRARERVILLLGDHQPPAAVSGDGATWDVPLHVIARQPELIDALLKAGFEPGLGLPDTLLAPIHEASLLLLDAFHDPAHRPVGEHPD